MAEGFITRRGGGVDVSDATATENDVLQGETFYSGDKDIKTGNIPSKSAETFTPGTTNQTIASGQYLSGTQTILGDPDLVPSNIKDGVNIFGVTGTLVQPSYYLSFDGVDDYVAASTVSTVAKNSNFAIEMDIIIPSGINNGIILTNVINSLDRFGFRRNDDEGVIEWSIYNGSSYFTGKSYPIIYDTPLNIKISFINGVDTMVVNGTNATDDFTSMGLGSFSGLRLGSRTTNSVFSEVKYNYLAIYNDDFNTKVLEYNFDEGSGTTLNDSAGNNDGTIVGATWGQE